MFSTINKLNFDHVSTIYEEGIKTGIATFEKQAPSFEKWDEAHLKFGRIAYSIQGEILGWGALSKVSDRCVYSGIAEVSIYIGTKNRRKGIGGFILEKLI